MSSLIASGMRLSPARLNVPDGAVAPATATEAVTAEEIIATVTDFTFRAGWAYAAHLRATVYGDAVGRFAHFRLRKTNLSGADFGEYGRYETRGTGVSTSIVANGMIPLVRSAATDLTATVVLTAAAAAGTISVWGGTGSPRYLLIAPLGPAAQYAGAGVEVT